ncbi:MAG: histidinol-phosphate transaminase [Ornithinimicrobium sp.]
MTTFPMDLVRPDLQAFTGYSSARTSFAGPPARIWLNANEAAEANAVDPHGRSRRYPQPQPAALRDAYAAYLGAEAEQLLLARGSDEAIDVLVRALCRPGSTDGIVVCSPTFGMYAVSAELHGVPVHDVPQRDAGARFVHDLTAVARRVRDSGARIVFIATPGNPSGSTVEIEDALRLAKELSDVAMVVLDEAYVEFAEQRSVIADLDQHPTLAVLRTMSKAHGLAGARIGALVAHPDLVSVLRRVQAPYPLPAPVTELAVRALDKAVLQDTTVRIESTVCRRNRLAAIVARHPGVSTVYRSEGNFVLARCLDVDQVIRDVATHSIAIRDMRHLPGLHDAVRVSVGTDADLDALADALAQHENHEPTSERTR